MCYMFYLQYFSYVLFIIILKNVRVEAAFDTEYFQVYSSSINGTYHEVKALKRGTTVIEGQLKGCFLDVSYHLFSLYKYD